MTDNVTLDELRQRVTDIDRQLIALVAERKAVSEEVARVKRATGNPTRDYERERDVILGVRAMATERGVSPGLAEQLLRLLIRSSLTTQEQASVVARGTGTGRRALVIGGAGKMGGWFVSFLASQGFAVEVADTGAVARGRDARRGLAQHVTSSTTSSCWRRRWASRMRSCATWRCAAPRGDLRCRLAEVAAALRTHGAEVPRLPGHLGASDVRPGHRAAVRPPRGVRRSRARGGAARSARELFAPTMAEQVVMSLDDHDRLIAYVLGLSHALNIAFFTALAESGEAAPKLARMSSTTFDAQLDVASRVAQESPELYYEIQSLNDYGAESLEALSKAVERIRTAVRHAGSRRIRCIDAPRTRLSGGPAHRRGAPGLRACTREHV